MLEVALDRLPEDESCLFTAFGRRPNTFWLLLMSRKKAFDMLPLPGQAESAGSRPSAELPPCSVGAEPDLHGCTTTLSNMLKTIQEKKRLLEGRIDSMIDCRTACFIA